MCSASVTRFGACMKRPILISSTIWLASAEFATRPPERTGEDEWAADGESWSSYNMTEHLDRVGGYVAEFIKSAVPEYKNWYRAWREARKSRQGGCEFRHLRNQ